MGTSEGEFRDYALSGFALLLCCVCGDGFRDCTPTILKRAHGLLRGARVLFDCDQAALGFEVLRIHMFPRVLYSRNTVRCISFQAQMMSDYAERHCAAVTLKDS